MFEKITTVPNRYRNTTTWELDTGNNVYYTGSFNNDFYIHTESVISYHKYDMMTYNGMTHYLITDVYDDTQRDSFTIKLPTKKEMVTYKLAYDLAKLGGKYRNTRSIIDHLYFMCELYVVYNGLSDQDILELVSLKEIP